MRDILTKHGIIEIFEIPHELRFLVDSTEGKIDGECLGYSSSIDHITLIKKMIEENNEK